MTSADVVTNAYLVTSADVLTRVDVVMNVYSVTSADVMTSAYLVRVLMW